MITYHGDFNKQNIVRAARGYIDAYSRKDKIDEAEVPFRKYGDKKERYVQFVLAAGQWVFVGFRD